MSINWSEGQCSFQILRRCKFIESVTIVKVALIFSFTYGLNHTSQWTCFDGPSLFNYVYNLHTHTDTDTWLSWIWQIFFVTRSNSCTTLRSEWRPRVVQEVEFRPVKSISDENTDCIDFSRFFFRNNEHQIHISQHHVAKTKQKMARVKVCS